LAKAEIGQQAKYENGDNMGFCGAKHLVFFTRECGYLGQKKSRSIWEREI
jgi:hypothetical protein